MLFWIPTLFKLLCKCTRKQYPQKSSSKPQNHTHNKVTPEQVSNLASCRVYTNRAKKPSCNRQKCFKQVKAHNQKHNSEAYPQQQNPSTQQTISFCNSKCFLRFLKRPTSHLWPETLSKLTCNQNNHFLQGLTKISNFPFICNYYILHLASEQNEI